MVSLTNSLPAQKMEQFDFGMLMTIQFMLDVLQRQLHIQYAQFSQRKLSSLDGQMEKFDHSELILKNLFGQLIMLIKEESQLLIFQRTLSSLLLEGLMEKFEFGKLDLEI